MSYLVKYEERGQRGRWCGYTKKIHRYRLAVRILIVFLYCYSQVKCLLCLGSDLEM